MGYGTALGVIRAAREQGKAVKVYASETRPSLQGARLTAYELLQDGFDVTLVADSAVGYLMSKRTISRVIVGADRVMRTGHVFNKIGTYTIAVLASRHNIPFHVAAPSSSFDLEGSWIKVKIEERSSDEVRKIRGRRIAPPKVKVFNPVFDVTPPQLVSSIVTERGVIHPPYKRTIPKMLG